MGPRLPIRMEELTSEQAADILSEKSWALVPCGSVQLQGAALPPCTTALIAETAARRAVEQLRRDGVSAVVLPTFAYAAPSPRSVSLSRATVARAVADLVESALAGGFHGVVICPADLEDRTTVEPLQEGVASASLPPNTRADVPDPAPLLAAYPKVHPRVLKTSLMLAASPFLVREERTQELMPVLDPDAAASSEGAETGQSASAALGDRLFGQLAALYAGSASSA